MFGRGGNTQIALQNDASRVGFAQSIVIPTHRFSMPTSMNGSGSQCVSSRNRCGRSAELFDFQHRGEDIAASPCQADESGIAFLTLGSLAVIVGAAGGRAGPQTLSGTEPDQACGYPDRDENSPRIEEPDRWVIGTTPAPPDHSRALSRDRITEILGSDAPLRDRVLWHLLYESSARAEEVLMLDVPARHRQSVCGGDSQGRGAGGDRVADRHRAVVAADGGGPSERTSVSHRPKGSAVGGAQRRRPGDGSGQVVVSAGRRAVRGAHQTFR